MDSIFILIPIALIFTAIAIKAFFWAVDSKQYDDLDAAAHSILFEEDLSEETFPAQQVENVEETKASENKGG
ncbi:MAG: cbb3-type cytochrome oxidase assembly protein CcoS [Spongiibacteraceae bacterium]